MHATRRNILKLRYYGLLNVQKEFPVGKRNYFITCNGSPVMETLLLLAQVLGERPDNDYNVTAGSPKHSKSLVTKLFLKSIQ